MSPIERWWLIVGPDGHAFEVRDEQPDPILGHGQPFKDRVIEVAATEQLAGAVSRKDTREWILTGDPARVDHGPPVFPGTGVRVVPKTEWAGDARQLRGAVEERDRLREVLRAVLMEPDPIKRNQLAAPVLTNPGGGSIPGA